MSNKKYLINTHNTHVSLMEGRILIEIGEWAEISEKDASHEHVDEAIRRGWLTITDTRPGEAEGFKSNLPLSTPDVQGTTDFAEAKAKARKNKVVPATA